MPTFLEGDEPDHFLKNNTNIHTDMSANSNIWANLNIKVINSLVRFVNAKGEGERTVF